MSHESLLPYVLSEEEAMICEDEGISRGYKQLLQTLIDKKEHGKNERFIITETRIDGEIKLAIELLQFYPPNVLIDHFGLK